MSDDLSKKVLLSIQSDMDDAIQAVENFKQKTQEAAQTLKATKEAINAAKIEQANYSTELKKGQVDQQNIKTATAAYRLELMKANQAHKEAKQAVTAAAGSYNEAQQKLTALGKAIKSVEGGFKSNDPAIQKQIQEYKQLNKELGAFDAKLGNHQRNVGNYSSVLSGLNGTIGQLIPGFNQFSGILQSATQGFNAMKSSSTEAGEAAVGAEGAIASGALAAVVAISAVVAAIIAESTYLLQFQKYADGLSKTWAGVKGSAEGFMTYMNNNNEKLDDNFTQFKQHWADFFHSIGIGYAEASKAQGLILDLGRQSKNAATLTAEEDMRVQLLIKDIRDRTTSATQAQKDYNEVISINATQYKRNYDLATKMFDSQVNASVSGLNLNKAQLKSITDLSLGYEKLTANAKSLLDQQVVGKDFLDQYNQGLQGIIAVENKKTQSDEMAKIRDDMKASREATAAEKAKQDLLSAQEAFKKAQSDRTSSIMRTLEITQAAYGKELSQTREHFRQLIFEQEKFIDEQEKLKAKTKSQKVKDQANKNIGVARGNITQIGTERDADVAEKMRVQAEAIFDLLQKSSNELANAEIANIQDVEQKQLAALAQRRVAEKDAYEKERTDRQIEIDRLQADYAKAKGKQKDSLGRTISELEQIQRNAHAKELAEEEKFQNDKLNIQTDFLDKQMELQDQARLVSDQRQYDHNSSSENDKAIEDDEKKLENDRYRNEISQEGLTNNQLLLMKEQHETNIDNIIRTHQKNRMQEALKWEELVQNAATSILRNAIESNYEYTIATLERQKTYELQNQSLTNTQKAALDEKYRVEEGKAKQKEFRQEQVLKIGEAIMAGAKAVVEDLWNPAKIPFDIATTAAQVAVIAAQKPPAYAVGGVHVGDGPVFGPGTSTSDSINARLSNGESVINAKSTAMFAPLLSAMNVAGGGVPFGQYFGKTNFATGGNFGSYLPTSDNGLRINQNSSSMSVITRMHPDDLNSLANAILNAPPPVVDVKDINNQQQKLVNVQNRSSR